MHSLPFLPNIIGMSLPLRWSQSKRTFPLPSYPPPGRSPCRCPWGHVRNAGRPSSPAPRNLPCSSVSDSASRSFPARPRRPGRPLAPVLKARPPGDRAAGAGKRAPPLLGACAAARGPSGPEVRAGAERRPDGSAAPGPAAGAAGRARPRSRPSPPWASCRTRCAAAPSPASCCVSTRRSGERGARGGTRRTRGSGCSRPRLGAHGTRSGHRARGWAPPSDVPSAWTPGPGPSDTPPPSRVQRGEVRAGARAPADAPGRRRPLSPQRAELRGGHRLVPGAGFPAADPAHLHVGERHGLHHGGGAVRGRRPCPGLCPRLRRAPQEVGVSRPAAGVRR